MSLFYCHYIVQSNIHTSPHNDNLCQTNYHQFRRLKSSYRLALDFGTKCRDTNTPGGSLYNEIFLNATYVIWRVGGHKKHSICKFCTAPIFNLVRGRDNENHADGLTATTGQKNVVSASQMERPTIAKLEMGII